VTSSASVVNRQCINQSKSLKLVRSGSVQFDRCGQEKESTVTVFGDMIIRFDNGMVDNLVAGDKYLKSRVGSASKFMGPIPVQFGSQVSLRVHYCKRVLKICDLFPCLFHL